MAKSPVAAFFDEACERRDRGDWDGAIEMFRVALAVDPDRAFAWAILGRILADRGELLEAIACLRRATRLMPAQDVFAACLYFALIKAARYEEAEAEAIRFIHLVETRNVACAEDIRSDLQAMVDWPAEVKAIFQKQRD